MVLLFHVSAILRLLHEVRDVADSKVLPMFFTLEMSHELKPVPVNFDALLNVFSSFLTLATFHLLRSAFISPALLKV